MTLNDTFENNNRGDKSKTIRRGYFMKYFLTILLVINGIFGSVFAQQYPIRLVPVVFPPYNVRLSDYALNSEPKLQLQVLMTDLLEPPHKTGIKFSLESGGRVIAVSTPFVNGLDPFLLQPGNNISLSNLDLKPLFKLENLSGISPANYAKALPDGLYQYCFQAYDFYTKNNLSQKSCASVYQVLYEPPFLNLPQKGEKVTKKAEFQGLAFNWSPRQTAPNTKYIFTLKEIWDKQRDLESAFLTARVLWKEETFAPSLYYGVDKTQLIPGKRYAWQVQAVSGTPQYNHSPIQEGGVYKNNGLSEIFFFDYVENCPVPAFLMAKTTARGKAEIQWMLQGDSSKLFRVEYRKKGSSSPWLSETSYQNSAILSGLENNTEYEYRVGAVCGENKSFDPDDLSQADAFAYSGVQYFTTNFSNPNKNSAQCGVMPAVDLSNKKPYDRPLTPNEVFTAGDFPVTVITAQGTAGNYTGEGFIQVPYLADTKIKVIFNNIQLNSDKQLINGTVETAYDTEEGNVMEGEEKREKKTRNKNNKKTSDANSQDKSSNENNDENNNEKKREKESSQDNNKGNNSSENDNSEGQENDNTNPDGSYPKNINNKNTQEPNKNPSSKNNDNKDVYAIKHLNKKYKNNETLILNYNRTLINIPLEFVGGEEKHKVQWELFNINKKLLNSFEEISQKQEFNFSKYKDDKFKIIAKVPELKNNSKVELNVIIKEKDFISQLSITDSDNKNRKAKAGEILYFINKPTIYNEKRKVVVDANPTISINEIHPEKLQWKINNITDNKLKGKERFTLSLTEKGDKTITSIAGHPKTNSQNAQVKWVDNNYKIVSFNHKIEGLLKITNILNNVSKKVEKVLPCSISLLKGIGKNLTWQSTTENIEDEYSRYILQENKFEFILSADNIASLKCSKELGISVFGKSFELGELYAEISIGANMGIENTDIYYLESHKLHSKNKKGASDIEVKGEVGLTLGGGYKKNGELIIGAYGGGKVNVTGGGKIEYPYNENSYKMGVNAYINPVMYNFTAEVKLGPLSKELSYSGILIDIRIESDPIIIDLK